MSARYPCQICKFIPGILLLAALAAIVATYEEPKAPERYGDVARRECAREAGRSKQDQQDCYDMKLVVKSLQMQSARDARR